MNATAEKRASVVRMLLERGADGTRKATVPGIAAGVTALDIAVVRYFEEGRGTLS